MWPNRAAHVATKQDERWNSNDWVAPRVILYVSLHMSDDTHAHDKGTEAIRCLKLKHPTASIATEYFDIIYGMDWVLENYKDNILCLVGWWISTGWN